MRIRDKYSISSEEYRLEKSAEFNGALSLVASHIMDNVRYYDVAMKKKTVKDALVGKLQYNHWIILYDLLNSSYHNISHDIKNGKITLDEVLSVVDRANSIQNIFDKNIILDSISVYM